MVREVPVQHLAGARRATAPQRSDTHRRIGKRATSGNAVHRTRPRRTRAIPWPAVMTGPRLNVLWQSGQLPYLQYSPSSKSGHIAWRVRLTSLRVDQPEHAARVRGVQVG